MTKEQAYDTEIAPLMTMIIAACNKHKIGCLADFALDDSLKCTTCVEIDEDTNPEMMQAYRTLTAHLNPKPVMITVRDKNNKIVRQEVVL